MFIWFYYTRKTPLKMQTGLHFGKLPPLFAFIIILKTSPFHAGIMNTFSLAFFRKTGKISITRKLFL